MLGIWIVSIIASVFVAQSKNRSIAGWLILSIFFGPLALIILALLSKIDRTNDVAARSSPEISLSAIKAEFETIKTKMSGLILRLNSLEKKISALESGESQVPVPEPVPVVEEKTEVAVPEKVKEVVAEAE